MSEQRKLRHQFKHITVSNLGDADEQSLLWMQITSAAKTQADWVNYFFRPIPNDSVPDNIVALLEVARGAMIYGLFFCPLVTLGSEQCYRVLEAAIRLRCDQLGLPTKTVRRNGRERDTTFNENLDDTSA